MKILLLGPPGAGKGTQASLLCEKFLIGHISTGEMLRQAIYNQTSIGLQVKEIMDAGKLVGDELIINLVENEIAKPLYKHGFLLDGFPRSLIQAKALQSIGIKFDLIVYLNLEDQVIIDRLSGRRYHESSGRVYHTKYNPPKQVDLDDLTGEKLIIREDDQESVIRNRLSVYHQTTKPLIEWYQNTEHTNFININANAKQTEIFSEICNFLIKKL